MRSATEGLWYYVEEDVICINTGEEALDLTVKDEDSLLMESGRGFFRENAKADLPPALNPLVDFDSVASLSDIDTDIYYPSSILEITVQDNKSITFSAIKREASIEAFQGSGDIRQFKMTTLHTP